MIELICPVCRERLEWGEKSCRCSNNHSFDIARQNYVNLLTRSSENTGDNPMMSAARHEFLAKGCYSHLAEAVSGVLNRFCDGREGFGFADAGCSDGYYTDIIYRSLESEGKSAFGADLSKYAVKLAGRSNRDIKFAVSSVFEMPLADSCANAVVSIFAPIAAEENLRILKNDGILTVASPGKRHLFELKEAIYDNPYQNDGIPAQIDGFRIVDEISVSREIFLDTTADIKNLFLMTPYVYKTSKEDEAKLDRLESLAVTTDFLVTTYMPI